MNPIKLSKQLQSTLVSYLMTTFDVNRDDKEAALAKFIRESFSQPRALFAGPYLELTAPYHTAETLEELVQEGVITPELLRMTCFQEKRPLPIDAPLYTHQATALRKLCVEERNIVVSSGTGSGKTECFLIPILNDLLKDPTPGVRAVLIYPLNALVNDQLDRLRVLLRGTNITFGRYTSELKPRADDAAKEMRAEWETMEKDRKKLFNEYPLPNEIIGRDQIREQGMLPQILITNYAMLEYLLLRPQDSPLFTQGKWRFIVLDEAHTYAGTQGIEVGLLIRRLKHRLGIKEGQMRCIATSATLTDDDVEDAQKFANALFGETFKPNDIIFGEPNNDYVPPAKPYRPPVTAYIHEQFDKLIHNVRQEKWENADKMALLMHEIGLIDDDQLSVADQYDEPPRFLWEVLRGNEDLSGLRNYMVDKKQPVEVKAVAEKLFAGKLPTNQQEEALYHLIELAAMAREKPDEISLLPARYHLFVRPPQGIWACINPTCAYKPTNEQWSKLFASPRAECDVCQAPVYPLVVCRTCGQVYVRLQKVGKTYEPEAALEDEPEKRYVTWRPINENCALAEEGDEEEDALVKQAGESVLTQKEMRLCIGCRQEVRGSKCSCGKNSKQIITLHLLQETKPVKKGKRSGFKDEIVNHMKECGRCHSRALGSTEIATEVTLNALTPLAILTEDLYRVLPPSNQKGIQEKAGEGRKLLSFYDSRQGAARFASFVQDVVNRQAYRQIIQEAVTLTATDTFLPDLEQVSEKCVDLALIYRVAHNDLDLSKENLPLHSSYLTHSQKERMMTYMWKHIFAEVTTQLRSRQALEALGIISVQYFEPDHVPDFSSLAQRIGLSPVETRTLIEYLLDELRRGKVVKLHDKVQRDDTVFGRNKFSPRLVRENAGKYELPWIGKTPRHRRRQLIRKIFQHKGLSHDEESVKQALHNIFTWLVDESDLFDTSNPAIGYQLRHDHLFFQANTQWYRCDQCQRLNSRGNALPCPSAHCKGTLHPVDMTKLKGENFYYDNLRQQLVPMRIEEHTAQLDPKKGRKYQSQFKNGNINMLSCSTTFEMGIDLGDLQAVVMSNIPPTVANYKQRAGRAGRRTSGTAFILAWASNRPHDQTYFKTPANIIGGHVRVPYLNVQNDIIRQRHINAILLSEFLRYCAKQGEYSDKVGAFFDEQTPGGAYYARFEQWQSEQNEYLLNLLDLYALTTKQSLNSAKALERFGQDLRQKGYNHYEKVADFYKESVQKSLQQQQQLALKGQMKEVNKLSKVMQRYGKLLDRLNNESIINHLSDRGVLPSYSFPLHTVELRLPPEQAQSTQLRLQRDLQQAIREYAPGQEVVADKRIWKSAGLDYFGKEPQVYAYHICPTCNHLRLVDIAGKPLDNLDQPCPICHTLPKRRKNKPRQYIQPDGFRVSYDSGKPAGQYVDRPFNVMRSALVPKTVKTQPVGQLLSVGYERNGSLLYVNEGFRASGFKICPVCGKHISDPQKYSCDGKFNGQDCASKIDRTTIRTLGFKHETDMLHLRFSQTPYVHLPQPDDNAFWLSLKYALLQGASRALQIERKDIEGVLFPQDMAGDTWQQTIVLYDNVPGGAGHVKRIQDEMSQVVSSALAVVDCECEKSCYRCLREYGNQWEHHLLERDRVIEFLRALEADLQAIETDIENLQPVSAIHPMAWLWDQVKQAKHELLLSVESIQLTSPVAHDQSWLDLLQMLLQNKVKIQLYVRHLPDQIKGNSEAIMIATQLRFLLPKLDLYVSQQKPKWGVVIDAGNPTATAITTKDNTPLSLTDTTYPLQATHHRETVQAFATEIKRYRGRTVEYVDLQEPAGITIIEVTEGRTEDESHFFADFYASPVRRMLVNDRYLDTKERILKRLGAHIELAQQHQTLELVTVQARDGGAEQQEAIRQLKARFSHINITFKTQRYVQHDRYIEVTRTNGEKARLILGVGLDFIRDNGTTQHTFLVFQDPYTTP